MLETLSALMLAAHLLCMNLATGGPLVALWLQWCGGRGDQLAAKLARSLTAWSIGALVVGVLLGGAMTALAWHEHGPMLQAAFELLPARRYWFGAVEIVFSLICLMIHLGMTGRTTASLSAGRQWVLLGLLFLAGTNLAYHFPPLFAMLGVYSTRAEAWGQPVSFLAVLADIEVGAHWVHFMVASAALTGVWLAWLALRLPAGEGEDRFWVRAGGQIALGSTVLQILSGLHLLTVTSAPTRDALLGGDMAATNCFVLAVTAAVVMLHSLADLVSAKATPRQAMRAMLMLATVVVLMVGALQSSRRALYRDLPSPARQATAWGRHLCLPEVHLSTRTADRNVCPT